MSRKSVIAFLVGTGAVVASILTFGILELIEPSFYYDWKQERMVRRVMTQNPEQLLSAARELLHRRPGFTGHVNPSALDLPVALRRLRPTEIWFATNAVSVDFSDVANPFGITAYEIGAKPPPPSQYGARQWIEGLWVHDDGQLETYGQPVGPANGSHTIRPETNRTSSAAGSRR
jgi:hypothetical protein